SSTSLRNGKSYQERRNRTGFSYGTSDVQSCFRFTFSTTTTEEKWPVSNLLITTMLIGYARVSTQDQTLNLQKDALEKIGCSKIFTDTISGAAREVEGRDEALQTI